MMILVLNLESIEKTSSVYMFLIYAVLIIIATTVQIAVNSCFRVSLLGCATFPAFTYVEGCF